MEILRKINSPESAKWNSFIVVALLHAVILLGVSSNTVITSLHNHFATTESSIVKVRFQKEISKSNPKLEVVKNIKAKEPQKTETKKTQTKNEVVENRSKEVINNGQNSVLSKYTSEIQKLINKNKFYPTIARRMGHTGLVKANFILDHSGKVQKIVGISGKYKTLENAVEEIIMKRTSFPSFPKELTENTLSIIVPINFEI